MPLSIPPSPTGYVAPPPRTTVTVDASRIFDAQVALANICANAQSAIGFRNVALHEIPGSSTLSGECPYLVVRFPEFVDYAVAGEPAGVMGGRAYQSTELLWDMEVYCIFPHDGDNPLYDTLARGFVAMLSTVFTFPTLQDSISGQAWPHSAQVRYLIEGESKWLALYFKVRVWELLNANYYGALIP